ncbi:MAG TPA: pyrimidine dimer DNA glycosylase/endonuclease V [Bacteroidia bacterium]|nr:pyrimidine dimer DNA glycosylase/endonuclease V [Bacteroidia bacterium]
MQTFLTSFSFEETAKSLDSKRLNKQCLEAIQLYELVTNKLYISKGFATPYKNHPAFKWWENEPKKLAAYIYCMTSEMYNRFGTLSENWDASQKILEDLEYSLDFSQPKFLTAAIILSHRNALLYKTLINERLYFYCFSRGLQLREIRGNGMSGMEFMQFVRDTTDIINIPTFRVSTSAKVPKYSDVLLQRSIYEDYKRLFPNAVPQLDYVW